ncbi:MAG TPA: Hsp20/alpha crystallin family protein [Bryobacteraceae bacterium]|jgi:HSP20 family protein|nr:Hsp20/alpha crystallin family protein [Bryobacteraceae bacterium]
MTSQETKNADKQNQQPQANEGARGSQGNLMRRASLPVTFVTPMDFFRMNPFSLMRRMTEEMDRIFGDGGQEQQTGGDIWAPAIDVSEHDGNYVVRAELPGLKPENVKLEIENDALVLRGERKVEREEDKGGMHRAEIRYGRFYRSIPLPEGANVEQARARFDNGVLEVTVPVPEQRSQRKEIPIQSGSAASATAA